MCLLGVDTHNRFRMYTVCTCTVNHTYAVVNIINCICVYGDHENQKWSKTNAKKNMINTYVVHIIFVCINT